jgi:hypothetical protein
MERWKDGKTEFFFVRCRRNYVLNNNLLVTMIVINKTKTVSGIKKIKKNNLGLG